MISFGQKLVVWFSIWRATVYTNAAVCQPHRTIVLCGLDDLVLSSAFPADHRLLRKTRAGHVADDCSIFGFAFGMAVSPQRCSASSPMRRVSTTFLTFARSAAFSRLLAHRFLPSMDHANTARGACLTRGRLRVSLCRTILRVPAHPRPLPLGPPSA